MAAVNPAQKLPILPPTPAAPPKAKAEAQDLKQVAQPKTIKVAAPAPKVSKAGAPAPAPKFKVSEDKPFLPSPPSIGEKARAARGKAQEPRPRINIVG